MLNLKNLAIQTFPKIKGGGGRENGKRKALLLKFAFLPSPPIPKHRGESKVTDLF